LSLHRLAQNNRWRRCHRCQSMIELTQGCFHMTCWYVPHICSLCCIEKLSGCYSLTLRCPEIHETNRK
jgi:hypothetical protein